MKKLLPALALLALAPFVSARLEENLPATTYGLVKIESVATTRKNLETNPVSVALKADRFKEFFKPFIDKAAEKSGSDKMAEFDRSRDEIVAAFQGEALFAIVKTPQPVSGHEPYDYIVLADTTLDQDAVAALLKKLGLHQPEVAKKPAFTPDKADPDDQDETSSVPDILAADEEYNGVTLHTLYIKEDGKPVTISGWAVVDKTLVYASAPNVLRELVDSRKSLRKDSFIDGALYKENASALKDADAWLLLDMPLIAGVVHDFAAKKVADGEASPMFDMVKAVDTLGLDALTHVRLTAGFKQDDTHLDTSIAWSEDRGVVKVFVDPVVKNAAPDLTVLPDDVMVASAARYDVSLFFANLETLAREAFPLAGPMLDGQLSKMKTQGLDIRSALLANFGDSVWCLSDMKPNGGTLSQGSLPFSMDTVYVLSLKDEGKFNSFIETALGQVAAAQTGDGAKSLFDERELLGVKIRTMKAGDDAMRIRYAVNKGLLFVSAGDGKTFDRTIAQFIDPKGGVFANPEVKAAIAKMPPDLSGISYYDIGRYVATYGKILPGLLASGRNSSGIKLDAEKAPRAEDIPFVAVGYSKLGDKELTSHTTVIRKSDANR